MLSSFLPGLKFSDSSQKPWTIVRGYDPNLDHFLWSFLLFIARCYELKFAPELHHSVPLEIRFCLF